MSLHSKDSVMLYRAFNASHLDLLFHLFNMQLTEVLIVSGVNIILQFAR